MTARAAVGNTGRVSAPTFSPQPAPMRRQLPCSAQGCRADAVWSLKWNNPRLHSPERRKVWPVCAEHRQTLGDFLTVRGFLRDIRPLPDR